MTDLTELVARLRDIARGGTVNIYARAADALEALAKENAALKEAPGTMAALVNAQAAEIAALKARAEAAEAKVARLVEALEYTASSLGWSGAGLAYERARNALREIGGQQ